MELIQNSSTASSINGSKNADLIPDEYAYESLLLLASTSDNPSAAAKGRAAAVVQRLRLTESDAATFSEIATSHRAGFLRSHESGAIDETTYGQQRMNRIAASVAELRARLTPLGASKLSGKIHALKVHMKLFPLPSMGSTKMSFFDRLFSLRTVHAQTMNPYGVIVSEVSYDDTTGTLYGTGITNASSYCGCHNSLALIWQPQAAAVAILMILGMNTPKRISGTHGDKAPAISRMATSRLPATIIHTVLLP